MTSVFRCSTKEICRDVLNTAKLGPQNLTDQAKTSLAKKGRDMVEADLAQICAANADVIVRELKQEIEFNIPEAGEVETGGSKKMMEKALVVMQSQIGELRDVLAPSALNMAMESAIVKAIFEDPKTAATKCLELLKVWAELRPASEKEVVENAAKNLLNFQGTKSYLTLLDFDTALFKILSKETQAAFRSLQQELKTAMNKPAQEIKMDKSE